MKTFIAKFNIHVDDPMDNAYRTLIIPAVDLATAINNFEAYLSKNYGRSFVKQTMKFTQVVEITKDTVIGGW